MVHGIPTPDSSRIAELSETASVRLRGFLYPRRPETMTECRTVWPRAEDCAARPGTSDHVSLNLSFRIFRTRILESRVEAGMPSVAAAPDGPDTFPFDSANAASIISRSRATNASPRDRIAG